MPSQAQYENVLRYGGYKTFPRSPERLAYIEYLRLIAQGDGQLICAYPSHDESNFGCLAERFIQLKPSRDESPVNVPLEPDNSITVADVSLLAGRQAEVSVFCGYSYHSFTRYLCLFSRDASERYRGEFGRRRVRACQICANLTPIPRGRPYFVNPFNQIKEKPETSGETLLLSY